MAVPSSHAALTAFEKLISRDRVPFAAVLHQPYLPDGYRPVDPTADDRAWLWKTDPPPVEIGGYGNPDTYLLSGAGPLVGQSPAVALESPDAEAKESYRRHSVDLTMRGGTTSGVVYPLAVCEIASRFRVRNVGGASAGAIAAAATAAAEVGRSSDLDPAIYAERPADGHVRPGFVGMADTIAWLAQAGGTTEEYRLAQLFRAAPADRKVFAVGVAAMRKQLWAIPLAALAAFGWISKTIIAALAVGAVLVTADVGRHSWPKATIDLVLFFVAVAAVWVLLPALTDIRKPDHAPPWLAPLVGVSSRYQRSDGTSALLGRILVCAATVASCVGAVALNWWDWAAGALVGSALSTLLVAVVGSSIWRYVASADKRDYGLVGGASPPTGRRRLSELLAGAARPTVERALVPWLNDCLTELAGLPAGTVLRFGHLWMGHDFHPDHPDLPERCRRPRTRLVNLELITTDLSRQRPYRFPLADDADQIYLCLDELTEFFPREVLDALRDPEARKYASHEPGGPERVLHRLPSPWNVPVIFAVRLSLALPGLFKAVRVYRLVVPSTIRDDLGRALCHNDEVLTWPDDRPRAEPLWFSDGGISSNFPVNLFDVLLPSWPTFGLNLGEHPFGFPHQDVWLPQDWQATQAPSNAVPASLPGFVGTILNTARSWRDTMQTGMPGYRGRIAWVRQRPDEGGTNLFMPREIIASLALRGALAGARLSHRFADPAQDERYRWLRMRAALGSLAELGTETSEHLPAYADLLHGTFLDKIEHRYPYDPYSAGIGWYRPTNPDFWTAAQDLLNQVGRPQEPFLTENVPSPHPDLKQSPPI